MDPPASSVYIIQGEMTVIMTAMRRTPMWSSHSQQQEDGLLKSFVDLNELLVSVRTVKDLDANVFLSPFLDVIRSEDTTGPVTGLALSAVNKFLSYGMIDCSKNEAAASAAVQHISDAVTHARFVGTDPASDEVVLMKILQVLRTLLLSDVGCLLTNESVCEIMQSCFRICFETRLSELLRKSAEHTLVDLVQLLFARLPMMSEDNRVNNRLLKMKTGSIDTGKRGKRKGMQEPQPKEQQAQKQHPDVVITTPNGSELPTSPPSKEENAVPATPTCLTAPETLSQVVHLSTTPQPVSGDIIKLSESPKVDSVPEAEEGANEEENVVTELLAEREEDAGEGEVSGSFVNQQGVKFFADAESKAEATLVPYGLPSVRELLSFLSSLINPADKSHSDVMIHSGLNMIAVALETGSESIEMFPSLLSVVKNELARHVIMLLSKDRVSMFAAVVRVGFLLFEALRSHLKLQLETFLVKLMEVVSSESQKVPYELRELALDVIVRLWRIPGLVTELYLNYDCNLFCTNLFEDLTKMLSKNAFPVSGMHSTHILSLDALLTVIHSIENHCQDRMANAQAVCDQVDVKQRRDSEDSVSSVHGGRIPPTLTKPASCTDVHKSKRRHGASTSSATSRPVPTHEELMAIKRKKKLLSVGSEHFNTKATKGVQFLQENGLLSTPLDPNEIAAFLRDNPLLDKRMIGEYVSNKKHLKELSAYVKSFEFQGLRVDEALRLYLEAFRLPGEAPLISLVLEHFAEHWHNSNDKPFANADAAFTLAYATIMLNVDQHNHNVKRQNNPMTLEEFTKNLNGVNGGKDFEKEMIARIYHAIHNDEIVMPAEHSGLVRENYEWKVLLRRGETSEGVFVPAPPGIFDHDLFSLVWGPVVAALSYAFDRATQPSLVEKAVLGFRKCASIAGHYNMSDVFDNLAITLCKFTCLLNNANADSPEAALVSFGANGKAQLALRTVFALAHKHGDILREGWKNLLDCLLQLFKAKALPKCLVEAEDFVDPSGKVCLIREEQPQTNARAETGLFSGFLGYITLSDSGTAKGPTPEEEQLLKVARTCVKECHPEQLITESKFLRLESLQELVKALIFASPRPELTPSPGSQFEEKATIFFFEILVKVVLQNRDRAQAVWKPICDHVCSLIISSSTHPDQRAFLLERSVVGLLRMATRLMRREELTGQILSSLRILLSLLVPASDPHHHHPNQHHQFPHHHRFPLRHTNCPLKLHREIAFGLHELLKTNAANIHSGPDWTVLFSLLECFGAGARPLPALVPTGGVLKGYPGVGQSFDQAEIDLKETQSDGGEGAPRVSTSTLDTGIGSSEDRGYLSDSEVMYDQLVGNDRRASKRGPGGDSSLGNRTASMDVLTKTSPSPPVSEDQSQSSGWLWVGKDGEMEPVIVSASSPHPILGPHDPAAFLRSCDTLAFLVRDAAHVTPFNFAACLRCIRTFVEASLDSGPNPDRRSSSKDSSKTKRKGSAPGGPRRASKETNGSHQKLNKVGPQTGKSAKTGDGAAYDADESDSEEWPCGYHQAAIQLLDLLHTLHTRAASIFEQWAEEGEASVYLESLWETAWCPLLQAIARICCDQRKEVRTSAVTYLQRALLVPDLRVLTPLEWEGCFHRVLFPLLGELLATNNSQGGPPVHPVGSGLEETRMRAATLLSKVFLQHLTPLLDLPTFTALWLSILDCMEKFLRCDSRTDLLGEAIPESLKNMLLVMETAGVFNGAEPETHNELWDLTWERISSFLPGLKEELSRAQHVPRPVKFEPAVELEKAHPVAPETVPIPVEPSSVAPLPTEGEEPGDPSCGFEVIGSSTSSPLSASPPTEANEAVATVAESEKSGSSDDVEINAKDELHEHDDEGEAQCPFV